MNRLLILTPGAESFRSLIEAADLRGLEIQATDSPATGRTLVNSSNIVLGAPSLVSEVLSSAGQLQWVQSSWAGVDHLCKPGLRQDYILTGVKGVFGPLISEYVMTYLFALERQVFTMRSNQLSRHWQPLPYRPARDIRLGIVGLGSIGQHLARSARYFGLQVTGLNRSGKPCDEVEKVYMADDLAGFLGKLDYIVLTLPETAATRHFIDAGVLSLMKPGAVLVNVGRGNVIKEDDLIVALQRGIIGGAVLDVFTNEPLPRDNPLWDIPGVYVTPHNAATSFTEDIVGIFVDNYQRFVRGQKLNHVVDFNLGY